MWEAIGGIFVCGSFIFLVAFFIWLIVRRIRIEKELNSFFSGNQFIFLNALPSPIFDSLKGFGIYYPYKGTISKNGKQFTFYWVYGFLKNYTGGTEYVVPYLIIFFPAGSISQSFLKFLVQTKKTPGWTENLLTWAETHYSVVTLPDETIVIESNSPHTASAFQRKLNWIFENIS